MRLLPIAQGTSRELLLYGVPLLAMAIGLGALPWPWKSLAILPLSLLGLLLWFFRDPDRSPPAGADCAFLAPADGVVVDITTIDEYAFFGGQPAQVVGIYLSLLNVHVNRIPETGTVVETHYQPGEFRHANHPQSSKRNESMWIGIERQDGSRYAMRQISGAVARRIVCRLDQGQSVTQGERFGIIKLGSRAELILPASALIAVSLGDRVTAGVTKVATQA